MKRLLIAMLLAIYAPKSASAIDDVCVNEAKSFPKAIQDFLINRCYCDHFRGEPVYDEERGEFLKKMTVKYCTGTDTQLRRFKNQFKNDASTISKLNQYEENIETKTP